MIDNPLPDQVMEEKEALYVNEQFEEHCSNTAKEIAKDNNLNPDYYDDFIEVEKTIADNREDIQCVISSRDENSHVYFGQAQYPQLHDYADNIDTMDLLLKN